MACDGKIDGATIVDFKTLDDDIKQIILLATEAREAAYVPYSNFKVGACVQCEDKTLYTGCNIENASYGLSICAERTALVKAISEGRKKYKAIAVVAHQEKDFTTPCGSCRQFLAEFGTDTVVYITGPKLGNVLVATVKELLPYSFSL